MLKNASLTSADPHSASVLRLTRPHEASFSMPSRMWSADSIASTRRGSTIRSGARRNQFPWLRRRSVIKRSLREPSPFVFI